jgi:ATP-dependent DNA ligase
VNKNLDATKHGGGFSTTELNATVSILGGGADRARELQLEGNPLQFFVFDCLEFGDKDLKVLPLRERRVYLEKLINTLEDKVPFKIPDCTVFNKMKFFDDIVSGGGEGIVLKSLEQPYFVSTARKRFVQVKLKRQVTGDSNEDLDVFISGSFLPKKNSALDVENLIGGIKVSVMLREDDGTESEYWIGSVSGITDSLRRQMTTLDNEGKPTLNPDYLGKVITVTGQDVSSANMRLSHCRCTSWNIRTDKNQSDCVFLRSKLLEQIL